MKLLREFEYNPEEIAVQLNNDGIRAMYGSTWTAFTVKEVLNREDSEKWRLWVKSGSKKIQVG